MRRVCGQAVAAGAGAGPSLALLIVTISDGLGERLGEAGRGAFLFRDLPCAQHQSRTEHFQPTTLTVTSADSPSFWVRDTMEKDREKSISTK